MQNITNYSAPEWIYNLHWVMYHFSTVQDIQGKGHGCYINGNPDRINVAIDNSLIYVFR